MFENKLLPKMNIKNPQTADTWFGDLMRRITERQERLSAAISNSYARFL